MKNYLVVCFIGIVFGVCAYAIGLFVGASIPPDVGKYTLEIEKLTSAIQKLKVSESKLIERNMEVYKRTKLCLYDECLAQDLDGRVVGSAVVEGYYGSLVDQDLGGRKAECLTFKMTGGSEGLRRDFFSRESLESKRSENPVVFMGLLTDRGRALIGAGQKKLFVLRKTASERESLLCEPDLVVISELG